MNTKEQRLQKQVAKMREALIWCGGSADFGPGRQARKGWVKIVKPLLQSRKASK